MKNFNLVLVFISCLTFYSCENEMAFSEPQPTNTKNLSQFPNSLQGNYIDTTGIVNLLINDSMVIKSMNENEKIHKSELDKHSLIIANNLVDTISHTSYPINQIGDSIIIHIHLIDTIFNINNEHVVRKMNDSYYLSTKYQEKNWNVMKATVKNEFLYLSKIICDKKENMVEETNVIELPADPPLVSSDSNSSNTAPIEPISMTRKEFRKFVEHDGFNQINVFRRIE